MAKPAASSAPELAKAPQPSVDRIEELASRILSGDVLLPRFQRDFVWTKKQIIDLWDSIAKNYPMGSVLLWRSREVLQSERNIADLTIAKTKEDYPVNYLLDGQQRLSSVCGALYWNGDEPDSRWNVAYDMRTKKFFHLDTLDSPPNHQIRVNWLPNPALFFSQLARVSSEVDEVELRISGGNLFNRFKDYKIATVTLLETPMDDVAPIFERINSKGTPLTIVDLMRAATWSGSFDLMEAIDGILEEIKEKDFGGVDKKAVLRSFSASAGGGFSEGSIENLRRYSSTELQAASTVTKVSFQKSVDFMSTDLGIPTDQQIPYVNQVVVLSEIFRLVPRPSAAQNIVIRQWFWRAAISSYFGGWNTGNMATDQAAVKRFSNGDMSALSLGMLNPGVNVWLNQQFRLNTAHAKILTLMLAFNRPVDILTHQAIDTAKALHYTNSKEYHHFFPKAWLAKKSFSPRKINSLANFVMLTAASNKIISNRDPSDYLKQVEQELGNDLHSALERNLISDEAFAAAVAEDYDSFLAARAKTIADRAAELAGW
jgi:hypothetical protein